MKAVFAFCFVLESCEHQTGKIKILLRLVRQEAPLVTECLVIIKIPNILQCTLPPRPVDNPPFH